MMQLTSRTRRRPSRRPASVLSSSLLFSASAFAALAPMAHADGLPHTQLVTGKMISPVGTTQNVGSLPMNMALTPDGKYALVSDMGFREYLTCLNTTTGQLAQPITYIPPTPTDGSVSLPPVSKSLLAFGKPYSNSVGLYYGLAVKGNGDGTYTVYAAEGANSSIAVVNVAADGSLTQTGKIYMPSGDFPAGLSLDKNGLLYVAVNVNNIGGLASAVSPGSLVIYDTNAAIVGTRGNAPEKARVFFNGAQDTFGTFNPPSNNSSRPGPALPLTPTSFPFAVDALADGSKVYVSSQRDGGVYVINLKNSAAPATRFIKTGTQTNLVGGSHPVSLVDNRASTTAAPVLYAANAGDDSVSVINTATDTVVKTISLRPAASPVANLPGVTPTGLALSADGATLYATLGDMNAVAVINTSAGTVTGAIPVGWYPTSVAIGQNSNILVANAKGSTSAVPNPLHVKPVEHAPNQYNDTYYDEAIIEGDVSSVPLPDSSTLALDTAQVAANNIGEQGTDTLSEIGLGGSGKIKHVIYIVKENRTYDQVLGDVAAGNGDASLAVFGQSVTPNLHSIVNQFALLDNFYDCAEVSGDGWNWSTEAMASEFVIKNVPNQYSSRGRSYDFEGQVNGLLSGGFPAKSPEGVSYSSVFPNGQSVQVDPSTPPGGYIWNNVESHGLSFRNYGFFLSGFESGLGAGQVPDNYPTEPGLTPGGHYSGGALVPAVNGHSDLDFRQFDTNYADSDAPTLSGTTPYPLKAYGKFSAKNRYQEWNREFQAMLAQDKTGGTVPNLMTIKFMSDHTAGYSTGLPTPTAHVADNDYAVGELVNTVSHSPIWNSTAIFVIEDDAQDGPDHIDCHRSTCYVISPYIKPNTVDHGFHNTSSVVKSIELLLGLPYMNQYDAYVPSFGSDFSATYNPATYTLLPETVADQTASAAFLKAHPAYKALVAMTKKMDFRKEDLAPAPLLNEVIWKSVKGMNSEMPAPRYGVIAVHPALKAGKTPVRDADGD